MSSPSSIASSQPLHLRCTVTPANSLAHTNKIYHNPSQFPQAAKSDGGIAPTYIQIQGKYHSLVFYAEPHEKIESGSIGLNKLHRLALKVSPEKVMECRVYMPPKHDIIMQDAVLEVDFFNSRAPMDDPTIDGAELEHHIKEVFHDQIFTVGQKFAVQFEGRTLVAHFTDIANFQTSDLDAGESAQDNMDTDEEPMQRGMLKKESRITFAKGRGSLVQFTNIASTSSGRPTNILKNGASFQKMGIGGLDQQLGKIFRRAFASRIYPAEIIKKLGVKHIKGILLYGPPGCGKTLMARQIGKLLDTHEPKIINGPEVLNKYVGESEANIRNLFADAEQEYAEKGDESDLHLIIFDEIDAICKQRGSVRSGTGVNDSVVNQLLSKIDGVNALNNVLLIGMTNRLDLIDEALLRPGRFEVQMEIGLPDEGGRLQILNIHTAEMNQNNALDKDVDLKELSARTKNFSGAEIEGLVKSASSFALNRNIDIEHLDKTPKDLSEKLKVTMYDFERALEEVKPAFGVSADDFEAFLAQGLIHYGPAFTSLKETCESFVQQIKSSTRSNILSVLLQGSPGAGKTSLAAHLAVNSEFPYVKIVSPQTMVGYSESMKCSKLSKVFDDAYKSPFSIIVLDDIERLIDYVNIGPRFSNTVLQALMVLIKKPPPKDRKLLVIGTTSKVNVFKTLEVLDMFNVVTEVPLLKTDDDIRSVLINSGAFKGNKNIVGQIVPLVPNGISIKQLLLVSEMAATRAEDRNNGAITPQIFKSALRDCGVSCQDSVKYSEDSPL
eukprot:CAMPEP_0117445534 /NCGR_PEP_ID=MMETSP0759-20121206/5848_1 /TAXON_ID=63605 /ORGANISM="Percolomonas cosmopolitus, Strain WS" /LENGTH=779 /DNA_ID=CAMNT_0005237719 /DNA_START=141 /DNA_END=2480 /DNA_ORIENTATION=+